MVIILPREIESRLKGLDNLVRRYVSTGENKYGEPLQIIKMTQVEDVIKVIHIFKANIDSLGLAISEKDRCLKLNVLDTYEKIHFRYKNIYETHYEKLLMYFYKGCKDKMIDNHNMVVDAMKRGVFSGK
ncbi:MAG: hypothetical protein ACRC92_04160 [Peptostreptococcaceae bacterium]